MTKECSSFYYLIANSVEFRPDENLLYSRENGEKVTLFVAASRCLQLLLNRQGDLVSQQELFDVGWNRNGIGVSSNTFYQNILMLRKGLKLAGCRQIVIKTVPRQGLTVPSSIEVEKIEGEAPRFPDEGEALVEGEAAQTIGKKKRRIPSLLWMTILSLSFCFAMLIYLLWGSSTQDKRLANYNYIGKIDRCSVYLYDRGTSLSTYQQFIAHNKVSCNGQEFIYFTTHPLLPRASVIRCKHRYKPGEKNSYIPEYQLEWQSVE